MSRCSWISWAALLVLVGCSGSTKTGVGSTPASADSPPSAAARPPVADVDATPDVPTAEQARRDAELAAMAAGYIDAFTNTEPVLTDDGKRLVFVSSREGLPQLHLADARTPDSPATRLIAWPQRVTDPHPTKDGKSLLFRSDTGADENWRYYRVDLDGKNLVELTPGASLNRDGIVVADAAPEKIFFSARKMAEKTSTVYSTSAIAATEPTVIYTDDKPAFLSDVSPDAKRGLVKQETSRSENHLLVLDLAAGTTKSIYPAAGKATIHDAAFSADGKRAYVATDGGGEQGLLVALDPTTGKELARYVETKPATATIQSVVVASKGGLVAVTVLAGQHSEIRLLDARTLRPRAAVKLPLGSGRPVEFSADGKRLTVQFSTPRAPTDAWAIDTKSGRVTALRTEARPSMRAIPELDVSIAEIDAKDGGKIPINVIAAAGAVDKSGPEGRSVKKHPVIVSYHGGPAGVSVLRWSPLTAYFVALGYVWVEPNVRGSSGFGRAFEEGDNGPKRVAAFGDIEASARWAAAQPWADKDRMVVHGGSYGGYTVLIALSRWPDIWRAGVDLFGVANLETFMATTSGVIRELFLVEFGDPERDRAFLASISPLTDVARIVDPTFVYAGANDPRVPRSESDLIVKELRAHEVPSEYMVAENEGHSLARRDTQIAFYARMARFLETHLR